MIILPTQARDKQREIFKKQWRFRRDPARSGLKHNPRDGWCSKRSATEESTFHIVLAMCFSHSTICAFHIVLCAFHSLKKGIFGGTSAKNDRFTKTGSGRRSREKKALKKERPVRCHLR